MVSIQKLEDYDLLICKWETETQPVAFAYLKFSSSAFQNFPLLTFCKLAWHTALHIFNTQWRLPSSPCCHDLLNLRFPKLCDGEMRKIVSELMHCLNFFCI